MYKLKKIIKSSAFSTFINTLIVFSILVLFLTKFSFLSIAAIEFFEKIDLIILFVFSAEFLLKLILFKGEYFKKDFGWIDLLSCIPILSPLAASFVQLKSLRIAKIIRFIRIMRVVRLFKRIDAGDDRYHKVKTNFFIGISSVTLIFILLTSIIITVVAENYISRQDAVNRGIIIQTLSKTSLITQIEKSDYILGATMKTDDGVETFGLSKSEIDKLLRNDQFETFPTEEDKAEHPEIAARYTVYFSNVRKDRLTNLFELIIMVTSIVASLSIIFAVNKFLTNYITKRIKAIHQHIFAVVNNGKKLPLHVDDIEDEITELERYVNRITDIYIV
jgi:hypothetical protein